MGFILPPDIAAPFRTAMTHPVVPERPETFPTPGCMSFRQCSAYTTWHSYPDCSEYPWSMRKQPEPSEASATEISSIRTRRCAEGGSSDALR